MVLLMELEFYRAKGFSKDIWFTDVNPLVLTDWAAEHNIKFKTQINMSTYVGIELANDSDKVMFELRWGGCEPRKSPFSADDYYDTFYIEEWQDRYDEDPSDWER